MKWTGRFAGYNAAKLRKDMIAGLIVGIIAIPLGMAFAIASGVKPEYGIYTIVIAGALISLFGGSKFQIGGPTGAFIPILFAIVLQYGYENLLIAGFMAGILLVLMGVFKLGALIKFIPRPVTIGFTSGIAVIIFSSQIANFLGLDHIKKHEAFLLNMKEVMLHLPRINMYSIIVASLCLVIIFATTKFLPKAPGPLMGLILSSIFAALFFKGHVATIESVYGAIPSSLPQFHFPEISWEQIGSLVKPAFVIAMLGGIESLLSAVVADGMTGSRHNSSRELIGQGIANMVTPLFGGIPATGAIARTATNIKTGAVSPISGMVHSLVVLLVLLVFAPFASEIPLASMAPILMLVAWNMSERKSFFYVLRTRSSDSMVMAITFLLTVLANLTTAVEIGLALAAILFIKRMSEILTVIKVLPDPTDKHHKVMAHMATEAHDCPQISIFNIEGSLFFGAANLFERSLLSRIPYRPQLLILRMGKVPFIDMTGESAMDSIVRHYKNSGGTVLIVDIQAQPEVVVRKTGLYALIGENHFFEHTGDAIDYAITKLDLKRCLGCKQYAFEECTLLSDHEKQLKSCPTAPIVIL